MINGVSKVIWDFFDFARLRWVTGPENSQLVQKTRSTLLNEPKAARLFQRWVLILVKFSFVMIGCCDYFGFDFSIFDGMLSLHATIERYPVYFI